MRTWSCCRFGQRNSEPNTPRRSVESCKGVMLPLGAGSDGGVTLASQSLWPQPEAWIHRWASLLFVVVEGRRIIGLGSGSGSARSGSGNHDGVMITLGMNTVGGASGKMVGMWMDTFGVAERREARWRSWITRGALGELSTWVIHIMTHLCEVDLLFSVFVLFSRCFVCRSLLLLPCSRSSPKLTHAHTHSPWPPNVNLLSPPTSVTRMGNH
ncbi:hypothetical protein BJ165DRAFT_776728 [Panaeolus papilionaceus]|nr:hypothetical protein BJ165DRAFT_776728 [Panaeolus papilionaceus]